MSHAVKETKVVFKGANPVPMLLSVIVGVSIWLIPLPEGIDPRAWHLFAVFAALIVGLIGKALPMGGISFLALSVLIFSQTLSLKEAFSGFAHPVVWLIVAAFLIARSVIKTGLGMRIAYLFVALLGRKTLGLSYGLCATELLLAPAMPSSTARGGGIIFPLVRALAVSFESTPERHSQRLIGSFLILTAYYSNIITSAMFITAMAANPLIITILHANGLSLSWGQWALAAIVPGLLSLAVIPYVVYKLYPPEIKETPGARNIALHRLEDMGKMSKYEWITLAVFGTLVVLWIFGESLGIDSTSVAFFGVSCLLVSGVLTWEDIKKEHEAWDTLIWFSTLVMIATYLNTFGLIDWMSVHLQYLMAGTEWWVAVPVLVLVYFYSHYLFASNTPHVTSMFAAFLGVGIALGAPPYLLALCLAFASSLFACITHYGTGCAPIFFGSEYVSFKHWWRMGAIVSVIFLFIWMGIGSMWWKFLGFW